MFLISGWEDYGCGMKNSSVQMSSNKNDRTTELIDTKKCLPVYLADRLQKIQIEK